MSGTTTFNCNETLADIRIPKDFIPLLEDLTLEVLKCRPENVNKFALYFLQSKLEGNQWKEKYKQLCTTSPTNSNKSIGAGDDRDKQQQQQQTSCVQQQQQACNSKFLTSSSMPMESTISPSRQPTSEQSPKVNSPFIPRAINSTNTAAAEFSKNQITPNDKQPVSPNTSTCMPPTRQMQSTPMSKCLQKTAVVTQSDNSLPCAGGAGGGGNNGFVELKTTATEITALNSLGGGGGAAATTAVSDNYTKASGATSTKKNIINDVNNMQAANAMPTNQDQCTVSDCCKILIESKKLLEESRLTLCPLIELIQKCMECLERKIVCDQKSNEVCLQQQQEQQQQQQQQQQKQCVTFCESKTDNENCLKECFSSLNEKQLQLQLNNEQQQQLSNFEQTPLTVHDAYPYATSTLCYDKTSTSINAKESEVCSMLEDENTRMQINKDDNSATKLQENCELAGEKSLTICDAYYYETTSRGITTTNGGNNLDESYDDYENSLSKQQKQQQQTNNEEEEGNDDLQKEKSMSSKADRYKGPARKSTFAKASFCPEENKIVGLNNDKLLEMKRSENDTIAPAIDSMASGGGGHAPSTSMLKKQQSICNMSRMRISHQNRTFKKMFNGKTPYEYFEKKSRCEFAGFLDLIFEISTNVITKAVCKGMRSHKEKKSRKRGSCKVHNMKVAGNGRPDSSLIVDDLKPIGTFCCHNCCCAAMCQVSCGSTNFQQQQPQCFVPYSVCQQQQQPNEMNNCCMNFNQQVQDNNNLCAEEEGKTNKNKIGEKLQSSSNDELLEDLKGVPDPLVRQPLSSVKGKPIRQTVELDSDLNSCVTKTESVAQQEEKQKNEGGDEKIPKQESLKKVTSSKISAEKRNSLENPKSPEKGSREKMSVVNSMKDVVLKDAVIEEEDMIEEVAVGKETGEENIIGENEELQNPIKEDSNEKLLDVQQKSNEKIADDNITNPNNVVTGSTSDYMKNTADKLVENVPESGEN